jgi:predicted CXXCH cytochrome family protein
VRLCLGAALLLAFSQNLWAFHNYDGCRICHGAFPSGSYTSAVDGTAWGQSLMDGHLPMANNNCNACHSAGGGSAVLINTSGDNVLSKGCVGCHGRDEDVNGNCVGGDGQAVECGSGAGLRNHHEANVGVGTCSACHSGDSMPVGENVPPYNYTQAASPLQDACNADGVESQFGLTGLDNDGDGQRDMDDADCQASGFMINAGINDAWVSADAPFQGFFFTVFPDIGFFFVSWFTFDSVPPAMDTAVFGASDQRWVTGGGLYSGNSVTVNVELTSGGVFNAADPLAVQTPGYGTITIVFNNCNEAILTYDFPSLGLSGQMTLNRVLTDNVALCEVLAAP